MFELGSSVVSVECNWDCNTSLIPDHDPQAGESFDAKNLSEKAPVPSRPVHAVARKFIKGELGVMFFGVGWRTGERFPRF